MNLENEYLKVVVLPDLGGHLYSCVDKSNGQDMFYANGSIKKARVSYRGAWTALGKGLEENRKWQVEPGATLAAPAVAEIGPGAKAA